ncbi:restriction endonuclease [Lentilactobacillus parabuchneri]|uniref:restriction endonuclease n=1 Tax=Lentilactobacillus parabuchneri TaxID=152331 RepID=UPI00345E9681
MNKIPNHLIKAIADFIRFTVSILLLIFFEISIGALFNTDGEIGTFIGILIISVGSIVAAYYVLPPKARFLKRLIPHVLKPTKFKYGKDVLYSFPSNKGNLPQLKLINLNSQISEAQNDLRSLNFQEENLEQQIDFDKQDHLTWTNKVKNLQSEYNVLQSKYDDIKATLSNNKQEVKFGGKLMTVQEAMKQRDQIIRDFDDIKSRKQQIESFYSGKTFQGYLKYRVTLELNKIDDLTGLEFESYITNLLKKLGFKDAKSTVATGDNGIDVLAHNGDTYYGIQCKLYSNPVGNQAVQQAYAGGSYYKTDKNIVVSNNYFTPSALQAADTMDVDLWDRDKLAELILDTFKVFQEIPVSSQPQHIESKEMV